MNEFTDSTRHDEIVQGPHPNDPPRSRRGAAVGLLTVGGLAAAGAALYVSNSAGATPSTSSSSSATASASASASSTCPAPGGGAGPKGAPGPGRGAGPGRPGGPGGDGLITAVGSSSLTVRDLFGTSHTYEVTSTTTIHSGPTGSIKLSALTRGEHVAVRTTTSTSTAADIDVHLAAIDGAVTSVSGSVITVTDHDGFTRTIDTDATTKYTVGTTASTRSTIKTGSVVHAEGSVDANGTALDATRVDVRTAASAKTAGPARCAPAGPHSPGGRAGVPAPSGSGARPRPGGSVPAPSGTKPSVGTSSSSTPSATTPATPTPSATTSR